MIHPVTGGILRRSLVSRPPGFASIAAYLIGVVLVSVAILVAGSGETTAVADLFDNTHVKRSSSAISVSAAGATLLAVNPDSGSVSIIDLGEPATVMELQVGTDPRTITVHDETGRAYVANRGDHSVSVIDLAIRQVVDSIQVGARPYGVVVSPDGRTLYVAEQGQDRLNVIDTESLASIMTISMPDRPSGLAVAPDGRTLFVTHLLRNFISVIDLSTGKIFLPVVRGAEGQRPAQEQLSQSVEEAVPHQETIPLWPDSNLVQSIIIAPDGDRAYVPHTRSNSSNQALTLDTTVFPLVSIIDLPTRGHRVGQQFNLEILDPPSVGLPIDGAFTPDGSELWVLNAASNDVTVIDVAARQRLAHIEVGDNPRGIVVSSDGDTAYVNNTLAGTVSVIDTALYTVTAVITATNIPLDLVLLTGKLLFNSSDDPRMGKDQWISCATCHFDGENDGQTWFLGFAGPRNTASLLGISKTLPLRWSGEWDESADSEFAIRMDSFGNGLIDGPMNCAISPPDCIDQPPHTGLSPDLDALAAYIDSLTVPLSPGHIHGKPLSEAAAHGQALFNDPIVGCSACHIPPLYTDGLLHDVGTVTPDERIGPAFNTPSLRGLYDTGSYFHDGSAEMIHETVTRPGPASEHDASRLLTEVELQDLIAFLLALPFEE